MTAALKVLLVEDNRGDVDLISELLARDAFTLLDISSVDRLEQALECVAADGFDIVLLDLGLPDSFGLDTLRAMRRQAAKLPIIVLTGNNDERTGLAAIREGAQDFLVKGEIDTNLLSRSIKYAVQRSQAENAVKELNDTLEERIAERTAQLTLANEALKVEIAERTRAEEALQQAKETAEAATGAKSQFLANMSHELRTPMTGILGMLDLIVSDELGVQQRQYLETAQASARSMVRILNDILDLTKIEMGKFSVEERPFLLRECVENAYNVLLPIARSKGLALTFSLGDDVPPALEGDQTRLTQVLTNLVGNAVKFTDVGEVAIRVSSGGARPGGKFAVTFGVSDTGIGIPEGKQDLLFKVFSQVDQSHSRNYGGTGLGLAISKEIVERMGGELKFTSAVGKGSTFFCTVCLGEASLPPRTAYQPGRACLASDILGKSDTRRPRLLIAEDDQTIRMVLGGMLERSRFEAEFAENGQAVVEKWQQGSFDLILMDVQMPGMNGFQATAAIRGEEHTRGGHIPILAMTAHALKEDKDRCLEAGMDGYISKPIDFKECLQLIRASLAATGGGLDARVELRHH
jgi:signal transduction histidine kinase